MNTVETIVVAVSLLLGLALVCTTVGTVETHRIDAKYGRPRREGDGHGGE